MDESIEWIDVDGGSSTEEPLNVSAIPIVLAIFFFQIPFIFFALLFSPS